MEFNPQYNTRAALITAIGSTDYVAFTTSQLFDGESREYVVVLPYQMWYGQRPNNSYRVIRIGDITNY